MTLSKEAQDVKKQIESMSLGDLCLLVGEAINMGMEGIRLEVLIQYLERALLKRSFDKRKNSAND